MEEEQVDLALNTYNSLVAPFSLDITGISPSGVSSTTNEVLALLHLEQKSGSSRRKVSFSHGTHLFV